jgi:hypothetical protein
MLTPDRFDVWTWTPGQSWRRVLDNADLGETTSALVWLRPMESGAAFSTVLGFNPNHATADDIAELADVVHGPIPDTAHRRRHAA